MSGLVKRSLYRPERAKARKKGVLHNQAPVACPDAGAFEIAAAIVAVADSADVIVGQGGEYNAIRDEYTIVGKSKRTGKAQDFKISGYDVAQVIELGRVMNGGRPMYRMGEKSRVKPTFVR